MLTTARYDMIPILKRLWRTSFGDEEAYTDFLFRHIPPQRILVWLEDKAIAAMLCFQPVDFKTPDRILHAVYMFGFNTHAKYRGQGIGTRLLEGFHQYIFGKGYEAACLAPASESLIDFYAKRGYENYFPIKRTLVEAGELRPGALPCVLAPRSLDLLYRERERLFSGSGLYARWPGAFLRTLGEECRLRGGEVLTVSCGGESGYVVALPVGDGKLLINEFALPCRIAGDALYALHKRYGAASLELRLRADELPGFSGSVLPFVMVRWYDMKKRAEIGEGLVRPPYFAHILD